MDLGDADTSIRPPISHFTQFKKIGYKIKYTDHGQVWKTARLQSIFVRRLGINTRNLRYRMTSKWDRNKTDYCGLSGEEELIDTIEHVLCNGLICLRNHLLNNFGDAVIRGVRDIFKNLDLKSVL